MNTYEQAIHRALVERGFTVYRNGWPDLLALDPDMKQGMALELKSSGDKLSAAQIEMHHALRRLGLSVYTIRTLDDLPLRGTRILMPENVEKARQRLGAHSREMREAVMEAKRAYARVLEIEAGVQERLAATEEWVRSMGILEKAPGEGAP